MEEGWGPHSNAGKSRWQPPHGLLQLTKEVTGGTSVPLGVRYRKK